MEDPAALLAPYVREGMTVLEPGPGMGFFTLELARRVGPSGRVVAVDIQPRMIAGLKRRAARARLLERIDARLAAPASLGLEDLAGQVDFVLAHSVVHELPDHARFFAEVARTLKPQAAVLFIEPAGHVDANLFERELEAAAGAGLRARERSTLRRYRSALLGKS